MTQSHVEPTYWANIYVGRQRGYDGEIVPIEEIRQSLLDFCKCGLGVTMTETEFIYTGGSEPGVIIGLINYPRFPNSESKIRSTAIKLTRMLCKKFDQNRATVVFPDTSVMIGSKE